MVEDVNNPPGTRTMHPSVDSQDGDHFGVVAIAPCRFRTYVVAVGFMRPIFSKAPGPNACCRRGCIIGCHSSTEAGSTC